MAKERKKATTAARVTDWLAIEQEWTLGQLDVREIARQHGITHQAIHNRAKRKGWPQRPHDSMLRNCAAYVVACHHAKTISSQ